MKKLRFAHLFTTILIIFITSLCLQAWTTDGLWPSLPSASAKKQVYNLSESPLFPRTLHYIEKNYVEPERIDPKEMFKGSLTEIQRIVPEILIEFNSPTNVSVVINNTRKRFSSALGNFNDLWKVMKEIFVFIELNYRGDVELKDIESLAIDGALKMLDPHSALFTPEFYKEFKIDTGGEFGGLGIVITSKDGQLTVIAPIEGTPAWRAGIRSGDIITEIDDDSTINMSLMKAVERLRGKVGSKVAITVERKGKPAPFQITMTRANIQIDSVNGTLIKDTTGDVGYIRVKRFQKDTANDFMKEIKQIQKEAGPAFKGLIIDLRNNPGGLLNEAIQIADVFLDKGVIVSTVGARKKFVDEDIAHSTGTEPRNYPVIILVNEGSASASEIVAGALQAYDRALIVGQKTFGKGTVQSVYELGNDYALKLTIAQYLTAGKHSIQTEGVTPDVLLLASTIDKEYLDLIPNKPSSEKELKKHLEQLAPIARKEKNIITFYKPYVNEDKQDEMREKEYSKDLDFKDDFEVKLATRVLLASKSEDPNNLLKESLNAVETLVKQEDEKITAKLSELGTNWETGKHEGTPNLLISAKIRENGKTIERAKAGTDIQIVLTATNAGKKTIYQLVGIIESENPLLSEKEFIFGKIEPGQSVSRESTVKIPMVADDRNIPYDVNFKVGGQLISYKFSSAVYISELSRPKFSFKYRLEKPRTVGAHQPLPVNKSVPLEISVKNVGKGPTKSAIVYVGNKKNIKGLFIEKGREKIGVVKPGETKNAVFAFRVLPSISNSTFTLELAVGDTELMEFLTTDLEFTVESGSITPADGIWYEGPDIQLAEKNLPITTNSDKYTLKGTAKDDGVIKDYFIFSGDDKVAYQSNPEETNTLDISATIKLKDGNNNISIIARDNNNLSTRKSFVIQKGLFK